MVTPRSCAVLVVSAAAVMFSAAANAQDASVIDAGARDASAIDAGASVRDAAPTEAPQKLALAADVAAAFPLDVGSRRAQRAMRVVRASLITMTRCSTEFSHQRTTEYNSRHCNQAWWAIEPTIDQPTFAAAIVGMLEAPTEIEQRLLPSEAFVQLTWGLLLREFTGSADAGTLTPTFVAFALRAMAALPEPSPLDRVARDLHHLLDRAWGYDPIPVAPWGDASVALGTRAQRQARLRRLGEFAMAHRAPRTAASDREFLEQSRRDLTSGDQVLRWRALQRLLRRRSMREVHREAVANLQALWRERASLPSDARSHINAQIHEHMSFWNLPQTSTGGFSFELRR